MAIVRYENLTHMELSALPFERTAVLVSIGPLEEHGPHLPLGTDAITAAFLSERLAERLQSKKPDWTFVLFPAIFAGSDTLTYTGSIEMKPWLLREMLLTNCKQLARDGLRNIIAVGAHGGPRHMVVLEEVSARMRWRHRARMVSASSRLLYEILHGRMTDKIAAQLEKDGQKLSDEEREGLKNDYHGGLLETSIMMVAKPDAVSPMHKTLRPAIVPSIWKLRRSSAKKAGEGLGHLGSPALARREIGQAAVEVILDETTGPIERFLNGENVDKLFRSKFYFVPFFRTDFKVLVLLLLYPLVLFGIWYAMSQAVMKMLH